MIRHRDAALLVIGAVGVVAVPVLGFGTGRWADALPPTLSSAVYYGLAAYVVVLRPRHRAAQRMLLWAVVLGLGAAGGAGYSVWAQHFGVPGWGWAAIVTLQSLLWLGSVAACALFAAFPDGEYGGRSGRRAVVACLWLLAGLVVAELLGSPQLAINDLVWADSPDTAPNPLAVPGLESLGTLARGLLGAGVPLIMVLGAVLLFVRFRRSSLADRRQIAWPLAALAATGVLEFTLGVVHFLMPPWPLWLAVVVYAPVLALIPTGLMIGVLKYQLLDLQVVVRRTVLYTLLWMLITIAYVLVAGVAGVVAGSRLPLAMAIATTVLVAVLFAPLRRGLERWADRMVFGRRVDHDQLLGDVGRRLAAGPGPEDAAAAIADAARRGLRASWVTVRLDGDEVHDPAGVVADTQPEMVVAIELGRERVGEIRCGPRADRPYTTSDQLVLEILGHQAAWSMRALALSTQLQEKVSELEASRRRLVRAEESERRRIERDLHDGVQAELVGLLTTLGLTENQLRRDPRLATRTLRESREQARRALENLQDFVHGIHPTILSDHGLVRAVAEQAARMPLPTTVEVLGPGRGSRWPTDIEAGLYFAVTESLANVTKHAEATTAWVKIDAQAHQLVIEVGDDGRGFDTAAVSGSGLIGLSDRLATLGGTLVVSSSNAGTRITLAVPTAPLDPPQPFAGQRPSPLEVKAS